jgi:hypothetical protein
MVDGPASAEESDSRAVVEVIMEEAEKGRRDSVIVADVEVARCASTSCRDGRSHPDCRAVMEHQAGVCVADGQVLAGRALLSWPAQRCNSNRVRTLIAPT